IIVQTDGKLVAAGTTGQGGIGNRDFVVARFSSNGILDAAFGNAGMAVVSLGSGPDEANTCAVQSDGNLLAAGFTPQTNNNMGVIRLLGEFVTTISETEMNSFSCYPNPVSDYLLNLEIPFSQTGYYCIALYNVLGEQICNWKESSDTKDSSVVLHLPSVVPGLYFIRIMTDKQIYTKQILIQVFD
ncbi:MAG: T9SS type A sorting domain-containing protein, partial [Bacteroidetes bacterium]|nr:T9SS type A sorting domain-containing protein [Bacteroidota bacterium]